MRLGVRCSCSGRLGRVQGLGAGVLSLGVGARRGSWVEGGHSCEGVPGVVACHQGVHKRVGGRCLGDQGEGAHGGVGVAWVPEVQLVLGRPWQPGALAVQLLVLLLQGCWARSAAVAWVLRTPLSWACRAASV